MLIYLRKNKFLVLMLVLTSILRLPSLFEPYWYGDEGIYLTLGLGIRKGLLLYRDIFDNKPPLIYLLAALAGNLFWFKFFLGLFCLGSVVLMARLSRMFFPKNELASKISLSFFAIFLNIPLIEGNIANAEIFQIFLIMAGVYLLAKNKKITSLSYFFSGVLFSLATLFKIPAVFDFMAIIIFLAFFLKEKKKISFLNHNLLFLLTGFLFPILITCLFFFYHHYLGQFIQIVFFQNLGYLSSWKTGSHQISLLKSNLIWKAFALFLFLIFLHIKKEAFANPWLLFVKIWLGFTLFASLLSERPYAHYLIQLLPPFCLVLGIIFSQKRFPQILGLILCLFVGVVVLKMRFWVYPVFPYYQNFFDLVLNKKNLLSYLSYFDQRVPRTYEIATYLVTHTKPSDKIFIWSDEPYIYALSRRLPASRFTVAYHIIDFSKFKETQEELSKQPPLIIVFDNNKGGKFKPLETLISANYLKTKSFENLEIFRLIKLK